MMSWLNPNAHEALGLDTGSGYQEARFCGVKGTGNFWKFSITYGAGARLIA